MTKKEWLEKARTGLELVVSDLPCPERDRTRTALLGAQRMLLKLRPHGVSVEEASEVFDPFWAAAREAECTPQAPCPACVARRERLGAKASAV